MNMLKYIAGEPEVDLVLIISNKDDIAAVARVIHQDTEPSNRPPLNI